MTVEEIKRMVKKQLEQQANNDKCPECCGMGGTGFYDIIEGDHYFDECGYCGGTGVK